VFLVYPPNFRSPSRSVRQSSSAGLVNTFRIVEVHTSFVLISRDVKAGRGIRRKLADRDHLLNGVWCAVLLRHRAVRPVLGPSKSTFSLRAQKRCRPEVDLPPKTLSPSQSKMGRNLARIDIKLGAEKVTAIPHSFQLRKDHVRNESSTGRGVQPHPTNENANQDHLRRSSRCNDRPRNRHSPPPG
jgi:hypothetical protein